MYPAIGLPGGGGGGGLPSKSDMMGVIVGTRIPFCGHDLNNILPLKGTLITPVTFIQEPPPPPPPQE